MPKQELVSIHARIPKTLRLQLEGIGRKRKVRFSVVIRDGLSFYAGTQYSPATFRKTMRSVFAKEGTA